MNHLFLSKLKVTKNLFLFQGGVKAVVYTDVLQILIMFLGLIAVVVIACIDVGGVSQVFKIANEGQRIEFFK